MARWRSVIRRSRSLMRCRLFGAMPRVPSAPSPQPRNFRSPTAAEPAPAKAGGALLLVDLEPQAAFQEPHHRGHDPFPRRRRPHIDVAVVGPRVRPWAGPRTGATAKPVAAWAFSPRARPVGFELLVQIIQVQIIQVQIIQQQIGEQRRQRAAPCFRIVSQGQALRRALISFRRSRSTTMSWPRATYSRARCNA
jgi:hypothetical protein